MAAVRQAPTGQLEAGIGTQMIEIVGILIAAGDGQHASAQNIGDTVRDQLWIAPIGDQPSETIRDPKPPLRRAQQHHPAIRGQATPIKAGRDFLAADGWKTERQHHIVGHGGCGSG